MKHSCLSWFLPPECNAQSGASILHEDDESCSIARTFKLDEIVAAHRLMESDQAAGKIVVLT